jgi:DNA polymerase-1
MDFQSAKQFIDRYFEIRRPIRDFLDSAIRQAEDDGFVETLFGRRRPTPDVHASNFAVREAAKRAAANMPIQGTEADLMKMAMLKVESEIPQAEQFMQIHDSIMVTCDPRDVNNVAGRMKDIMENIYPDLGVDLRVGIKSGITWADL